MSNANNRPRQGLNRANMRNGAAPRSPAPASTKFVSTPSVVVAPPPAAPASPFGEFLQIVGGVALMLLALALLLSLLNLIRDSIAVGKHLAEAKTQRSTLVCQDGRMVRGDGSLRDLVMADAYFVCTDWRTLQSIEIEESKGR
jgi:hypothetical protein